jgi:tRNA(His) 5'-end guanylyltransferase
MTAAVATAQFNRLVETHLPEKKENLAYFDSRAWTMPNLNECANCLLWREIDATKNSISMAAQHYYSHKELHGKNGNEKQEMLFQKGINWNDYPSFFKRGTYIRRIEKNTKFSKEEIDNLPLKHKARTEPDLIVVRHCIEKYEFAPLPSVKNRSGVLFYNEQPIIVDKN